MSPLVKIGYTIISTFGQLALMVMGFLWLWGVIGILYTSVLTTLVVFCTIVDAFNTLEEYGMPPEDMD